MAFANVTAKRATRVPAVRYLQTLVISQRQLTVAVTDLAFHRRGAVSALVDFLACLASHPQICAHHLQGLPRGCLHLTAGLTAAASRSQKSIPRASARTDIQARYATFHRTAAGTLHQSCVAIMGSARKARASAPTDTAVADARYHLERLFCSVDNRRR